MSSWHPTRDLRVKLLAYEKRFSHHEGDHEGREVRIRESRLPRNGINSTQQLEGNCTVVIESEKMFSSFVVFVSSFVVKTILVFGRCGSARWGYVVKFGATVKEINSSMRSTLSKRRKQARRSLICLSGSSGAASGRNLRSCSASVINRLKWPR